ncbi:MAG TPA: PAS domain-containing protein [Rhizomicrobium sp.]
MTPTNDRGDYRSALVPAEILPVTELESAELRFTLEYWQRLRGERAMPARSEILPKDIRHCLRYIHIYDVVDGGADFRARLVGTSVFPGLDQDQTGKLVSQHPDPGIQMRFGALLRHVTVTRAPARSVTRRSTGDVLRDMFAEGLWLPLGEGARVQHILAQSSLRQVTPGFVAGPAKPA